MSSLYKKHFTRRDFLRGGVGVVGMTALAACAPTAIPTGSSEESAAPEQVATGPVNLAFWTFVEAHADFYKRQVDRYNETAEVPISLETTTYPTPEMHDKLLISLQSGTGAPDLVDINISYFGTFLRGNIQLHDLTELVDREREHIIPERLAPYQYQGKQYGIPTHLGSYLMY